MTDPNTPQNPNRIQVQIDDATAQGTYANLALISHTETEFILDFIFVQPTRTGAKVQNRVILNPRQAKQLAATLNDAVLRYEGRFGVIPEPTPIDGKIVH